MGNVDDELRIERVLRPASDVEALVDALDRELATAYDASQRHGVALAQLFSPEVRFYVARCADEAVACGGFAIDGRDAELKRMFVRADRRRAGIAWRVLRHLEREARACGVTTLRLETGERQPAALALYERAGYRPCPAFGRYRDMPPGAVALSRFYAKSLAQT